MHARHTGSRRRSAVLAITALGTAFLAATTSSAGAAPPVEGVTEFRYTVCEGDGGGTELRLAVSEDAQGLTGNLTVTVDDRQLYGDETSGTLVPAGDDWSGSFDLTDAGGSAAGTATFAIDVVPGVAETTTVREHEGNVSTVATQTVQPLPGTATVLLPDAEAITLTGCTGEYNRFQRRTTQPDAVVGGVEIVNVACSVPLGDGQIVDVWVEGGEHTLVSVLVEAGEATIGGETSEAGVSPRAVRADVPLYGQDGPAGNASVDLTMEATGQVRFVQQHSTGREVFRIEQLAASGTLGLPGGRTIPLDCDGESMSTHKVDTTPSGPRASGPVPPNDAPAGAVVLDPGDRLNVHTRAAAYDAEQLMWCYTNEPEPDLVAGHTVWYRFSGTGGPVTVDTAGSQFNTVLAVYRVDGHELVEEACEDDHFREGWQARATVGTVSGSDYLVQVGGFGHQSGLARIALS